VARRRARVVREDLRDLFRQHLALAQHHQADSGRGAGLLHIRGVDDRVARNDPFLMRMAKAATNHAEETRGFTAHTTAAHAFYTLARVGEGDPDSYVDDPFAKRRPMVDVARENHKRSKQ
jgi:hypothetical protein